MNFRNRKVLSLFLSLALVIGILVGTSPMVSFAEEGAKTLTILHTNDIHGRVGYADAEEREPSIGHAKFKTYVEALREEGNVLVLDAGDVLHGTIDVNLSEGQVMVELMNLVGVDAMVPGNHDFNYGYERLLELKEMADFSVLAANVVHEADGSSDLDAYVIKEYDGFKVGIFGIATEETKTKSHPNNTKGIEFADYIETAKKAVADLQKEEVDIIVGLTHVGIDGSTDVITRDIAENVEGIDVIVDGHSHSTLEEGELVGDTLLVQAGSYLSNIGVVELTIEDGKVVNKKASLFTTEDAAELDADEEIEIKIAELKEINEALQEEVIGKSTVVLVGENPVVRTGESTLGNVITDAMLQASGADVALTNGGGIRASISDGDITLGDAMKAFPFTNFLSTIEVTGEDIVAAIEHGVKDYPERSGGFPHVAGMKYEFDPSQPAGERVVKVLVDGEEIDLAKTYSLVSNDFVAVGGDGYEMFKGKNIIAEGALLSDALVDYLKEAGEISPSIEGRIVALEVEVEVEEEVEATDKYTVVADDVLWKIAEKFNTTWEELAEYNNLENAHLIFPNQVILIP